MIRFVFALISTGAILSGLPVSAAAAADLPRYKRERYAEHGYQRPIPRVYYQSARPTMVCRVAFLDDRGGWPKERGVARCTRLD